jgi:pyruvate dehydrogenase E1 component alpha subunit
MSDTILRIIDDQGKVCDDATLPELGRDDWHKIYRAMLFNRRLDERMTRLQRQGRIGFYVGSLGEEAAIIGSAFALEEQDWLVPCYREAGAALLRGYPLFDFLCQIYGNSEDRMKGRQMPCHWGSPGLHLAVVSSPVGTQIPHAVGLAMGARIQGRDEVALTFFGDGATSEGDFHVACNFAGVYKAPVVFVCRNNQYAISIPLEQQTASPSIAVKSEAYGIEGVRVDGNDVLAVYSVAQEAVERARSGGGATLIEAVTYRQGAHSTSDDPRAYRRDEEVEEWKRRDPLLRFRAFLIDQEAWDEDQDERLEKSIRDEIQSALKQAERLAPPEIESLFEDVFDTVPWHLEEQRDSLLQPSSEFAS